SARQRTALIGMGRRSQTVTPAPTAVRLVGIRVGLRPSRPLDLLLDRLESPLHETSRNLHCLRVAVPHQLDALLDEAILHFDSALQESLREASIHSARAARPFCPNG